MATAARALSLPGPGNSCIKPGITVITTFGDVGLKRELRIGQRAFHGDAFDRRHPIVISGFDLRLVEQGKAQEVRETRVRAEGRKRRVPALGPVGAGDVCTWCRADCSARRQPVAAGQEKSGDQQPCQAYRAPPLTRLDVRVHLRPARRHTVTSMSLVTDFMILNFQIRFRTTPTTLLIRREHFLGERPETTVPCPSPGTPRPSARKNQIRKAQSRQKTGTASATTIGENENSVALGASEIANPGLASGKRSRKVRAVEGAGTAGAAGAGEEGWFTEQ